MSGYAGPVSEPESDAAHVAVRRPCSDRREDLRADSTHPVLVAVPADETPFPLGISVRLPVAVLQGTIPVVAAEIEIVADGVG